MWLLDLREILQPGELKFYQGSLLIIVGWIPPQDYYINNYTSQWLPISLIDNDSINY